MSADVAERVDPEVLGKDELAAQKDGPGRGWYAGIEELAQVSAGKPARAPIEPMSTGFGSLDAVMGGGLRRREVTVVLGDTGANKSSFCEQIALNVARHYQVADFSLELGRRKRVTRYLGKLMRLDEISVENLLANRPDHRGLLAALQDLWHGHRLIVEERERAMPFTWETLATLAWADRPDLVVIDDLQCIDGWDEGFPGVGDPRKEGYIPKRSALEVRSAMVDAIVEMAQVLDCHVLIPHQTRRELISGRPGVGDTADCMKLARRCDTLIAVHRPFRGDLPRDTVLEAIYRKNRPTGRECIVHLYRNQKQLRFEEMTSDEERELECCKPKKRRR